MAGADIGAAAVDFGSNLVTNLMQMGQSRRMQRRSMKFAERMSNTAYQRSTKDMLEAGLNPVLMYGHGGAASTPQVGGSAASLKSSDNAMQAVQSGLKRRINKKQMEGIDTEIKTRQTQQKVNSAVAAREMSQAALNLETKKRVAEEVLTEDTKRQMYSATAAQAKATELESKMRTLIGSLEEPRKRAKTGVYKSWFGKHILPWLQEVLPMSNQGVRDLNIRSRR